MNIDTLHAIAGTHWVIPVPEQTSALIRAATGVLPHHIKALSVVLKLKPVVLPSLSGMTGVPPWKPTGKGI